MELSFIVVIRDQCTGQIRRGTASDCDKRNKTYLLPPRPKRVFFNNHAPAGEKSHATPLQHLVGHCPTGAASLQDAIARLACRHIHGHNARQDQFRMTPRDIGIGERHETRQGPALLSTVIAYPAHDYLDGQHACIQAYDFTTDLKTIDMPLRHRTHSFRS
jgi:hypothetical protein